MVAGIKETFRNMVDVTRIPTHTSITGTGDAHYHEKEVPQHHEHAGSSDNSISDTPYPNEYVEYHYTKYPNRWSRIRELTREYVAEFLGVMILIIFGAGVDCQVTLSANPGVAASQSGSELSINFSWAVGTACGVWVSSGISGGHINPAVTLAFATFRDFPWRKVPGYILAQVLGGMVGAGIVYADYIRAIDIVEGGRHIRTQKTASMFTTFAAPYMTNVNCFFDEVIGTMVLLIVVCAFTDRNNGPPPAGLVPLALFIAILGIGASLGLQTGYAINPARDLGPRIMMAMVGYGHKVFTFRHEYWIWCPVIGPIVGAQVGILFYDVFLFVGGESLINRPDARARAAHEHARNLEKHKLRNGEGIDAVSGPALV